MRVEQKSDDNYRDLACLRIWKGALPLQVSRILETNYPSTMHFFIGTTKVPEIIGLKNLTNLFGILSFPSEFEYLRNEQMLKVLVVVAGNRNSDFVHFLERTGSLLCLIFASIWLPIVVKNSINLESSGIVWVWGNEGVCFLLIYLKNFSLLFFIEDSDCFVETTFSLFWSFCCTFNFVLFLIFPADLSFWKPKF